MIVRFLMVVEGFGEEEFEATLMVEFGVTLMEAETKTFSSSCRNLMEAETDKFSSSCWNLMLAVNQTLEV